MAQPSQVRILLPPLLRTYTDPAQHAALGAGSPQAYVDGFHDALWVGSAVALACAGASAVLLRPRRTVAHDAVLETG